MQNTGVRQGQSYDTGLSGDKATRFNAIKQEIIAGKLSPSINQLRKKWHCHQDIAKSYLEQLTKEGLLTKDNTNGHFKLASN